MRRSSRPAAVLAASLALVLTLASPVPASAAPARWESIDVSVHQEGDQTILFVSGHLPDDAPLPADVELALPAGSEVGWAGEILGGDPAKDPEVTYEVRSAKGMDVYSLRLTKARTAQIEAEGGSALVPQGTATRADLRWTAPWPVAKLRLSVLLPTTARIVEQVEGAEAGPGPEGYGYYQKVFEGVKAGQVATFTFAYEVPAGAAAAAGTPAQGGSTAPLVFILAAAAALLALFATRVARKAKASRSSGAGAVEVETTLESGEDALAADAPDARAFAADDGPPHEASEEPAADQAVSRGAKPRGSALVLGLVGVVLGVLAIAGVVSGGKATSTGDVVSLQIAQVDTCSTAVIPLVAPGGRELEKDAQDILNALRTVEGAGWGKVYLSRSTVEVGFCDSVTSEAAVRAGLASTGYVQATSSSEATAPAR